MEFCLLSLFFSVRIFSAELKYRYTIWRYVHNFLAYYLTINVIFFLYITTMLSYRSFICLSVYYIYDIYFIFIYILNLIMCSFGMKSLYCFITRSGISRGLLKYFLCSLLECLCYIFALESINSFVRNLSRSYCLFISLTIVLAILLIRGDIDWHRHFMELLSGEDPKVKTTYQKMSFKNRPLEENKCPICLLSYDEDPNYYLLACNHAAHSQCLESWWTQSKVKQCFYFCKR